MAENRYVGSYPVIGIRPTIDGRRGALKVRESLEEQTMAMARNAKALIEENLRYPVYVKPANLGSSIGITRAKDAKALGDLAEGLNNPFPVTSAMPHAGKCPACAQQMGFEAKSCRLSAILPEEDGIVIAYTSIYGHTKAAVSLLADELRSQWAGGQRENHLPLPGGARAGHRFDGQPLAGRARHRGGRGARLRPAL